MQRYLEPRMDQQDTFNESVSTLLERKVRGWLSGVFDDMRRSSPVQQWLDSLPADSATKEKPNEQLEETQSNEESTLEPKEDKEDDSINETDKFNEDSVPEDRTLEVPASRDLWKRKSLESAVLTSTPLQNKTKKLQRDYSVQSEGCAVTLRKPLFRDSSLQSDASGSSGSSVLNVLGARKVDAESVLLALGFGPSEKQQRLQRIPDRFLVPSKLKGISTEKFIQEEQHSMRMHDCGIFGYRGLTGNPHVQPSTIVAKIIERILAGDTSREAALQARHSVADIRSAALLARPRRNT